MTPTPDVLARLAIANLDNMSPARARWLLADDPDLKPEEVAVVAVDRLRKGQMPIKGRAPKGVNRDLVAAWQRELATQPVERLVADHDERGINLLSPLDARWPLTEDSDPPILVFYAGDLQLLHHPVSVAVVGTRRCTSVGRTVAYDFGRDLAAARVAVVSGLALGVDGAAHRGALDADGPVIGVVGSGIDVVYPGGNRQLWERVKAHGLLLSESPAKARPTRWRFPARNRLIAGLSQGVVVVESHRSGGALLTVDEAADRGRPVYAVPGSVLSPSSEGTNGLLVDGAIPVRSAADVLMDLGVSGAPSPSTEPAGGPAPDSVVVQLRFDDPADSGDGTTARDGLETLILAEVAVGPAHIDRLVLASSEPPAAVLAAVSALVRAGRVELDGSTVVLP